PDREYTDAQLRYVLLHELIHYHRKDIAIKCLSAIACAVHWYNPIAWFVRREIDRACELATDAELIGDLDRDSKQIYGDTLIYVAADFKMPKTIFSTTMCEEKKALKDRLGAIMKSKKHTRLAIIMSVALFVLSGCVAIALGAGRSGENSNRLILPEAENVHSMAMNQFIEHTPVGELEITDR
ncbi:MAG: M56 family metallopeptidase, partial [Clostridiales bacterium]|nr:M56 family metallopeptidase [Clostridiales bacterium]